VVGRRPTGSPASGSSASGTGGYVHGRLLLLLLPQMRGFLWGSFGIGADARMLCVVCACRTKTTVFFLRKWRNFSVIETMTFHRSKRERTSKHREAEGIKNTCVAKLAKVIVLCFRTKYRLLPICPN
jgi:hypothetical protein